MGSIESFFESAKEKYARENGLFAFETDIYNPGEFEEPDHSGKSEAQIARYRKNSAFLNRVRPAHLRPKRGTQTYSMLFFKKPEFNPKTGPNILRIYSKIFRNYTFSRYDSYHMSNIRKHLPLGHFLLSSANEVFHVPLTLFP